MGLTVWPGGEDNYFTGMMLKRSRVKFLESEIVAYPTTQMLRNLLVVQVCGDVILTATCYVIASCIHPGLGLGVIKPVWTLLLSLALHLGGFQRPEAVSDDVSPGEL